MPDTYYSWWVVTELHAWMMCVRLAVGNTPGMNILYDFAFVCCCITYMSAPVLNAYFLIAEGKHCRNFMVKQLYEEMDEPAKKVADMDRKSRLNTVWDLAEEFKVSNKIKITKLWGL